MTERAVKSMLDGLIFALIMWGIFTFAGAPAWTSHHLTEFVVDIGVIYALGSFSGRRDR